MKCDLCNKETHIFISYNASKRDINYCCPECWRKIKEEFAKQKKV